MWDPEGMRFLLRVFRVLEGFQNAGAIGVELRLLGVVFAALYIRGALGLTEPQSPPADIIIFGFMHWGGPCMGEERGAGLMRHR